MVGMCITVPVTDPNTNLNFLFTRTKAGNLIYYFDEPKQEISIKVPVPYTYIVQIVCFAIDSFQQFIVIVLRMVKVLENQLIYGVSLKGYNYS